MKYENIPIAIKQMAENALDKSSRADVRFNYAQSLKNIRDFCDVMIKKYEGSKWKQLLTSLRKEVVGYE